MTPTPDKTLAALKRAEYELRLLQHGGFYSLVANLDRCVINGSLDLNKAQDMISEYFKIWSRVALERVGKEK